MMGRECSTHGSKQEIIESFGGIAIREESIWKTETFVEGRN
jgi:hypothetical protein